MLFNGNVNVYVGFLCIILDNKFVICLFLLITIANCYNYPKIKNLALSNIFSLL